MVWFNLFFTLKRADDFKNIGKLYIPVKDTEENSNVLPCVNLFPEWPKLVEYVKSIYFELFHILSNIKLIYPVSSILPRSDPCIPALQSNNNIKLYFRQTVQLSDNKNLVFCRGDLAKLRSSTKIMLYCTKANCLLHKGENKIILPQWSTKK